MAKLKKVYRIKDIRTGKYCALGYRPKSSWYVFPSAAIKENKYFFDNEGRDNFIIEQYELVLSKSENLTKSII